MSKMNFAYKPPQATEPEVRLSLLTLGYLVLACALIFWMAKPLLIH
jgi:hypothetical protein